MTTTLERNAGPGPADRVARLAQLIMQLQLRSGYVERLDALIAELAASQLFQVTGEHGLAAELHQLLAEAQPVLTELAAPSALVVDEALDRLENINHSPLWELEREASTRLEAALPVVQASIAEMKADLLRLQAAVTESWKELDDAREYGVVDPERQARTSAVEGLLKQAETDATHQRYGRVGLALTQIAQIGDLGGTEDKLAFRLAAAHERVGQVVRHSELVLIRSEGPGSVLEYTALLRIPRSDVQRVDLFASSVLVVRDRSTLTKIVRDVAAVVDRNVRSARSMAATLADPKAGAKPDSDADAGENKGPATDPPVTRQFVLDAPAGPDADLLANLTEDLREVGQLMYTLFLPDEMQRLLSEARGSLTVTTNDLELPWELLHDGEDFLCLQRPVARRPLGRSLPRRPHRYAANSEGSKLRVLLVASDPDGNLPGARREVEAVRDRLNDLYSDAVHIECLIGPQATGSAMNDHLRSATFHVVHYAGHAAFDQERTERSRLLMHGDPPTQSEPFFAQKIERLLEGSPLVFLNACESSTTANERRDPSAYFAKETQGLAAAFLYGGATACVGSLWPVFDDTAAELASTFYQRLFEGLTAGEALRQARVAVRSSMKDRVTWAAYALYGDPRYELPLHPRTKADRDRRLPG